ncbi:hypothetical protein G7054_g10569 [Neopestalotiopsis clavispora]|nr:hypothetical protein G7054_g10569 [Neopestalotiopsis clavispora]
MGLHRGHARPLGLLRRPGARRARAGQPAAAAGPQPRVTASKSLPAPGGVAVLVCVYPGRDPATARGYLAVVALADLGHIYASYAAMGPEAFWDYSGWNHMIWGNVGVSAFLHLNRLLTLLGVFGPVVANAPGAGVKRA